MAEVTVAADDVRLVTDALNVAVTAYGAQLVRVPGFGDALEAAGRLNMATQQAAMPQDPVSSGKVMAIAFHRALEDLCEEGFERSEAFALVQIQAQAVAQLGIAKALHG